MSSKLCFECKDKNGRTVRLFKTRYYGHILHEHPEFERDFAYPASAIEEAITQATRTYAGQGKTLVYVGPTVDATSDAGPCRVRVVVNVQDADGWVVTAYPEIVF